MIDIFNSAEDLRGRGFTLRDPPLNIVAYDPSGDGDDRDGLLLVSREEWRRGELWDPDLSVEFIFRVLLAHRMPPELEVPDKVAQLIALHRSLCGWRRAGKEHEHVFCVETNGVGYGIAGMMVHKLGDRVVRYTTVQSLTDEAHEGSKVSVPRLASLDHLRTLLELHRFKSVKGGVGVNMLVDEMNAFVWRRKGRPEAMVGAHDDLVMPAAAACWIGTKVIPPITKQQKFHPRQRRATVGAGSGRIRVS